jgi:hypothetical protein
VYFDSHNISLDLNLQRPVHDNRARATSEKAWGSEEKLSRKKLGSRPRLKSGMTMSTLPIREWVTLRPFPGEETGERLKFACW